MAPATKPDDLRSIPKAHMMKGENWLLRVVLWTQSLREKNTNYNNSNNSNPSQIQKYNEDQLKPITSAPTEENAKECSVSSEVKNSLS